MRSCGIVDRSGLADRIAPFEELGISVEAVARSRARLAALYGMPTGAEPSTHAAATLDACRAYVGVRMHEPDCSLRLLRALRRRAHSDRQRLDELETIHGVAADAGLAGASINAWLADDEVEAAVRADMAATRDPRPEALALFYSCPRAPAACATRPPRQSSRTTIAASWPPASSHSPCTRSRFCERGAGARTPGQPEDGRRGTRMGAVRAGDGRDRRAPRNRDRPGAGGTRRSRGNVHAERRRRPLGALIRSGAHAP